ncbi:MAG: hypothetical protein IJK67_02790 [Bacilli bacterium]|nr:hypothetical protein [Bacilli bacterium]
MSVIKANTIKLNNLISDLNSCSLSFKDHIDQFNDLILKTDGCWSGKAADEYRNKANAFNTAEFQNFYLSLSSFISMLSDIENELERVINSNKGD